jgi:hypothetical protein
VNPTIKKLYNVLVVGGALAAAACDRPAQRPPTTPTADAAAAPGPDATTTDGPTTDAPATPDAATAPAAPVPAAGGVRGWFGG